MNKANRLKKATMRISNILKSFEYKCESRQKASYFSREVGKIGFVNMVVMTLNFLTKSLQTELNSFFEKVLETKEKARKQAYSEGRFKLTEDAFRLLYKDTVELGATEAEDLGLKTFKEYRVYAVDGSTVLLEDTISLRRYFGVVGPGAGVAAARISVMADMLNQGYIMDAQIGKQSNGERELALHHIERLYELQQQKTIVIFDRGYASAEMFEALKDTKFLFRVKRKFNSEIDRLPVGDYTGEFIIKKRKFLLRVVKFRLITGEIETLVSNLSEEEATMEELKELYNMRWGVETVYHTIKSHLELENFTGTSQLIVKQDFYATMFLKNMVALAKMDSDEIIEKNHNPENLHKQKTNENILVGILKDRLVIALLEPRPRAQARKINNIIQEAAQYKIPVRPDRHFPRKRKNMKRFHNSGKSSL